MTVGIPVLFRIPRRQGHGKRIYPVPRLTALHTRTRDVYRNRGSYNNYGTMEGTRATDTSERRGSSQQKPNLTWPFRNTSAFSKTWERRREARSIPAVDLSETRTIARVSAPAVQFLQQAVQAGRGQSNPRRKEFQARLGGGGTQRSFNGGGIAAEVWWRYGGVEQSRKELND